MPATQGGARLKHVTSLDSDCPRGRDEVETFWEVAVDSQCEGLMIKVNRQFGACKYPLISVSLQLLDSGDVVEVVEPMTDSSPKKPQTRKKSLPATYEPGQYKLILHIHRAADPHL